MAPRPPSPEELVDLAWMLDSALVLRQRQRALQAADRLVARLISHDEDMAVHRRRLDPPRAQALADECMAVLTEAVLLLEDLRRGPVRDPVQLRFRVQLLVDDEALAMPRLMSHTGAG